MRLLRVFKERAPIFVEHLRLLTITPRIAGIGLAVRQSRNQRFRPRKGRNAVLNK
jgi:hypothetical protein